MSRCKNVISLTGYKDAETFQRGLVVADRLKRLLPPGTILVEIIPFDTRSDFHHHVEQIITRTQAESTSSDAATDASMLQKYLESDLFCYRRHSSSGGVFVIGQLNHLLEYCHEHFGVFINLNTIGFADDSAAVTATAVAADKTASEQHSTVAGGDVLGKIGHAYSTLTEISVISICMQHRYAINQSHRHVQQHNTKAADELRTTFNIVFVNPQQYSTCCLTLVQAIASADGMYSSLRQNQLLHVNFYSPRADVDNVLTALANDYNTNFIGEWFHSASWSTTNTSTTQQAATTTECKTNEKEEFSYASLVIVFLDGAALVQFQPAPVADQPLKKHGVKATKSVPKLNTSVDNSSQKLDIPSTLLLNKLDINQEERQRAIKLASLLQLSKIANILAETRNLPEPQPPAARARASSSRRSTLINLHQPASATFTRQRVVLFASERFNSNLHAAATFVYNMRPEIDGDAIFIASNFWEGLARSCLAQKLVTCKSAEIRNLCLWGCPGDFMYIDTRAASFASHTTAILSPEKAKVAAKAAKPVQPTDGQESANGSNNATVERNRSDDFFGDKSADEPKRVVKLGEEFVNHAATFQQPTTVAVDRESFIAGKELVSETKNFVQIAKSLSTNNVDRFELSVSDCFVDTTWLESGMVRDVFTRLCREKRSTGQRGAMLHLSESLLRLAMSTLMSFDRPNKVETKPKSNEFVVNKINSADNVAVGETDPAAKVKLFSDDSTLKSGLTLTSVGYITAKTDPFYLPAGIAFTVPHVKLDATIGLVEQKTFDAITEQIQMTAARKRRSSIGADTPLQALPFGIVPVPLNCLRHASEEEFLFNLWRMSERHVHTFRNMLEFLTTISPNDAGDETNGQREEFTALRVKADELLGSLSDLWQFKATKVLNKYRLAHPAISDDSTV